MQLKHQPKFNKNEPKGWGLATINKPEDAFFDFDYACTYAEYIDQNTIEFKYTKLKEAYAKVVYEIYTHFIPSPKDASSATK